MKRSRGYRIASGLFCLAALGLIVFGLVHWYIEKPIYYFGKPPDSPTRPWPNFTEIEDGLWMGGSVVKPPEGTEAVLNLCETKDGYTCEYHRWAKIPDGTPAPELSWLREQVAFVDDHRKAGRQTYVHCAAGISRAGMVTSAYLMFKNDWTRDKALEYIRKKRSIVNPNPAFMERLLEWERELKKGG